MNQLHQMQIRFIPLQDRLVFRLNTIERHEYSFWFTRRYTKLLWKALLDMLDKVDPFFSDAAPVPQTADEQKKAAMRSFQHEQAVQQSDFQKTYEDGYVMPLGKEPLLVSKIRIKDRQGGGQVLCMHPEKGQGIELAMDEYLLHSFCKLLSSAVESTDWDLDLQIAPPANLHMSAAQSQRLN